MLQATQKGGNIGWAVPTCVLFLVPVFAAALSTVGLRPRWIRHVMYVICDVCDVLHMLYVPSYMFYVTCYVCYMLYVTCYRLCMLYVTAASYRYQE